MQKTTLRAALATLLSATTCGGLIACEPGQTGGPPELADASQQGEDAGRPIVREDGGAEVDAGQQDELDAGSSRVDGGGEGPDAGERPAADGGASSEGRAGAFVAQGYLGRTTVSCDDGRSWVANRSDDESARCFTGGLDCDHTSGRAKGIVYARDRFVANFGWGEPGAVKTSTGGVDWEDTLTGATYGGLASDGQNVVAASHDPRRSENRGDTWTNTGGVNVSPWNVRRAGFAGGRFLMVFEDSGDSALAVSADGGATWTQPASWPSECGQSIQNEGGIGGANGALVVVGGDGVACRSTDGGQRWTATRIGSSASSHVVSTDSEVIVWGGGRMYRSADGAAWTSAAVEGTSGGQIGAVARSPEGTFVAVNGGWDEWYERQRFYRSEDGVHWTELAASAATRSHPIYAIAWGEVDEDSCGE